jgi:hypothetical protein
MSEEMNFAPFRISQKQQKCRDALGQVRELNKHKRGNGVIGVPRLTTMRGIKEIVSGLALPPLRKHV